MLDVITIPRADAERIAALLEELEQGMSEAARQASFADTTDGQGRASRAVRAAREAGRLAWALRRQLMKGAA